MRLFGLVLIALVIATPVFSPSWSRTVSVSKALPPGIVGDTAPIRSWPSAVHPWTRPAKPESGVTDRDPSVPRRTSSVLERVSSVSPRGPHSLKVTPASPSGSTCPVSVSPTQRSAVPSSEYRVSVKSAASALKYASSCG